MAKRKDLTDRTFGALKVMHRDAENSSRWVCSCACGDPRCLGDTVSTSYDLTSGKKKSCGCKVKSEDLTGKRFGKLVVIGKAKNKNGRVAWMCQCDCGSAIKPIIAKHLVSGATVSCGCRQKESVRERRLDLTGQKFTRLTAICLAGADKGGHTLWNCLCDCGKTTIVGCGSLRSGHIRSCGCLKSGTTSKVFFQDLTGKRFGKLVVLKRAKNGAHKQTRYKCLCDCGKTKTIFAGSLASGRTQSCGCLQKSLVSGENNARWVGGPKYAGYEATVASIGFAEEIRRHPKNKKAAQVKCSVCGKWMTPTGVQVGQRRRGLCGVRTEQGWYSEGKLYCSDECKQNCSIYGQKKYPKGFKPDSIRSDALDPALNERVLSRDNHQCQKCGATDDLHVHHIEGVAQTPLLANDLDNCITVCHDCHAEIHSLPGCTYHDYRREACEHSKEAVALNPKTETPRTALAIN